MYHLFTVSGIIAKKKLAKIFIKDITDFGEQYFESGIIDNYENSNNRNSRNRKNNTS